MPRPQRIIERRELKRRRERKLKKRLYQMGPKGAEMWEKRKASKLKKQMEQIERGKK